MELRPQDSSQVPVGARLAKACNRCQARKIKCDGALPRCGPCSKTGLEDCNIEECVLWTQQHVAQLEERIEWLHGLVAHTYEAGEWIGGVKTGTILQPKPIKEYASEPLVEEVGLLSLRANGSYIGSMSGVTLTRLICTALRLEEQDEPIITEEDVPVRSTLSRAPYPPRSLAVEYITRYTQRIHRWYPFLDLNHLAETLSSVYDRGTQPDDFGRFTLNMIFALSSPIPPDQYTPAEYFRAALGLMTAILAQGSYDTVRVLLLLCLYGLRSWETPGVNCWQIIGHATRIGIELGLHRHRYRGGSEEIENESRRKLWWSTYSLERLIASGCCRVLSIRREAIDQYAPRDSVLIVPPALQPFLRAEAWQIDLRPSLHLIEQRSLLGEVLECVYTTRPRDRPSPPIAETSARVMQIQARLVTWAQTTPLVVQIDTIEHDVLQLAFHQATVLLHRPSPSFPNPAPDVLDVCLGAARRTIHVGLSAIRNDRVDDIMPGWAGFQMIFISGLTLMYCSWAAPECPNAIKLTPEFLTDSDVEDGLAMLETLTIRHHLPDRYCMIYRDVWTSFTRMLRPLHVGESSFFDPSAVAAQETGLLGLEGLELDPEAVEYISRLLAGSQEPTHPAETQVGLTFFPSDGGLM